MQCKKTRVNKIRASQEKCQPSISVSPSDSLEKNSNNLQSSLLEPFYSNVTRPFPLTQHLNVTDPDAFNMRLGSPTYYAAYIAVL